MVHEAVEVLHQYLFEHVQVSNQDMWLLSNVESVGFKKIAVLAINISATYRIHFT